MVSGHHHVATDPSVPTLALDDGRTHRASISGTRAYSRVPYARPDWNYHGADRPRRPRTGTALEMIPAKPRLIIALVGTSARMA